MEGNARVMWGTLHGARYYAVLSSYMYRLGNPRAYTCLPSELIDFLQSYFRASNYVLEPTSNPQG